MLQHIDCPVCHKIPKKIDLDWNMVSCSNMGCVLFDIDIPRDSWIGELIKDKSSMTVSDETRDKFMNPVPG